MVMLLPLFLFLWGEVDEFFENRNSTLDIPSDEPSHLGNLHKTTLQASLQRSKLALEERRFERERDEKTEMLALEKEKLAMKKRRIEDDIEMEKCRSEKRWGLGEPL